MPRARSNRASLLRPPSFCSGGGGCFSTSSDVAPARRSRSRPGHSNHCARRSRRSSTPDSPPDGKTIVYSAARRGNTPEIISVRPDFPGGKPLGLSGVNLLSVSSRGELAVLTRVRYIGHSFFSGTLGRMPLEGGAPREVLAGVREADWSPDGSDLVIIRDVNGRPLEFPVGKVLAETGAISRTPVLPRRRRIAFFEHPTKYDDRGGVAVVDLAGEESSPTATGEKKASPGPGRREVSSRR